MEKKIAKKGILSRKLDDERESAVRNHRQSGFSCRPWRSAPWTSPRSKLHWQFTLCWACEIAARHSGNTYDLYSALNDLLKYISFYVEYNFDNL